MTVAWHSARVPASRLSSVNCASGFGAMLMSDRMYGVLFLAIVGCTIIMIQWLYSFGIQGMVTLRCQLRSNGGVLGAHLPVSHHGTVPPTCFRSLAMRCRLAAMFLRCSASTCIVSHRTHRRPAWSSRLRISRVVAPVASTLATSAEHVSCSAATNL